MSFKSAFVKITAYVLATVAVLTFVTSCVPENDVVSNTAMITNLARNSGGTGTILLSGSKGSLILTNAHVCGVAKSGGFVSNTTGSITSMVYSMRISQSADLCLIKVLADFGVQTRVANHPPVNFYESATVSGHPELLPTVVTKGHYSGKAAISVMVDLKPCTEEDLKSEAGMLCLFLGGLPVMKEYDSQLVTATIMPGSSGSGVYNSSMELSGVVFAGSHDLGYAWIVPYESMKWFLDVERFQLQDQLPSNQFDLVTHKSSGESSRYRRSLKMLCNSYLGRYKSFERICGYVHKDLIWEK